MQIYANKASLMNKNYLTIKEAAKYLRVSKDTLRRWEKKKILKPFRSPTGWRYYSKRQLDYVFIQKPEFNEPNKTLTDKPKLKLKENIRQTQVSHNNDGQIILNKQGESKARKMSIIFLAFFVSLNLILIAFYLAQNIINH